MKKTLQRFVSLIAIIALCFSLSGCKALDEARANHAFLEDGNIKLGKYEYILLPTCEQLQPMYETMRTIQVTQPDVPVLLSDLMGDFANISRDGIFICAYDDSIYCRSDKYDEISKRIADGIIFDSYCYSYYYYNQDEDEWDYEYYILPLEQATAINTLVATVTPTVLPPTADFAYEYIISLEKCSSDMLFRDWSYEVSVINNEYYVTDTTEDDTLMYQVPDTLTETFKAIVETYIKNEGMHKF